jgi:hypothetical protein
MINEILASIAGNIPTLMGIGIIYYALRHLIRDEIDKAVRRLDEKVKTLNALRNIHK